MQGIVNVAQCFQVQVQQKCQILRKLPMPDLEGEKSQWKQSLKLLTFCLVIVFYSQLIVVIIGEKIGYICGLVSSQKIITNSTLFYRVVVFEFHIEIKVLSQFAVSSLDTFSPSCWFLCFQTSANVFLQGRFLVALKW